MKDVASPEMFPRMSKEKRGALGVRLTAYSITHHWFSQLLHQAAGFFLNSVLNAPLPHPEIPQGREGEAPGLLPSLAIAKEDSETINRREALGKEE